MTAAIVTLTGCAQEASKPVHFTYRAVVQERVAEPGPPFRSYPVSAAFERAGPVITREQRAWIRRIVRSRNYGPERSKLRFAVVDDRFVPIVVYRAHVENGIDNGGLIIGESCNALFDPHEFGFVTTPGDIGCDENAKPIK